MNVCPDKGMPLSSPIGIHNTYVTRLAKTRHNDAFFGNPDFCISEFCVPKALFCSNTNGVLQILFELQG